MTLFAKDRIWRDARNPLKLRVNRFGWITATTPHPVAAERFLNILQKREMFRIDWLDDEWFADGTNQYTRRAETVRGSAWGQDR